MKQIFKGWIPDAEEEGGVIFPQRQVQPAVAWRRCNVTRVNRRLRTNHFGGGVVYLQSTSACETGPPWSHRLPRSPPSLAAGLLLLRIHVPHLYVLQRPDPAGGSSDTSLPLAGLGSALRSLTEHGRPCCELPRAVGSGSTHQHSTFQASASSSGVRALISSAWMPLHTHAMAGAGAARPSRSASRAPTSAASRAPTSATRRVHARSSLVIHATLHFGSEQAVHKLMAFDRAQASKGLAHDLHCVVCLAAAYSKLRGMMSKERTIIAGRDRTGSVQPRHGVSGRHLAHNAHTRTEQCSSPGEACARREAYTLPLTPACPAC